MKKNYYIKNKWAQNQCTAVAIFHAVKIWEYRNEDIQVVAKVRFMKCNLVTPLTSHDV